MRDLTDDALRARLERRLDRTEHRAHALVVRRELVAPVGDVGPLWIVEERVERLVERVRVDERAAADAGAREHEQIVEQRHALDAAQAEPRHEDVAAQVPVRPREVVRPETPARFEHGDPVALLGEPERRDATAEPAADHEHIDLVRAHAT